MAGITGTGAPRPASGGVLGAEARAQYAALGRLRWAMLRNSLRSNKGVFELGARTLSYSPPH